MFQNPKISIVIPIYNVEKYIERCLNSVVNQTLDEIEIIIVNDGTKDNSMQICQMFADKDKRIKIFNKENEGLGLTRNYGLERASGEYVAFLDSDDYIDLDFYEKLFLKARQNSLDAVFADIKLQLSNDEIVKKDKIVFSDDTINSKIYMYNLLHVERPEYKKDYMGMCVWRSIYKRSILCDKQIKFVSEREYISEDIIFNIDFCMNSKNIGFVRDTYYYYCFNQNSLTKTYRKDRFEKNVILYNKLKKNLIEYGEYENVKYGLASLFMGYIRGVIKQEIRNSKETKKNKIDKIKYIVSNNDVREALKLYKYENLFYEIIKKFIELKCVYGLYYIYKYKR